MLNRLFVRATVVFAALLPGCGASPHPASRAIAAALVVLHPGLQYRELACRVGDDLLHLRQLVMHPGAGLELRAVLNATARTDPRCNQRYGGADIRTTVDEVPGFRVLAATNGNFFHRLGEGFRSNGMIWSRGGGDGSLLAPLQPTIDPDFRGDHIFVADASGGHEVRITTGACEPGACLVVVSPPPATPDATWNALGRPAGPMSEAGFVAALRAAFPTMSLALQINHAYADAPQDFALANSFRCSESRSWLCHPHPVTLLCAAGDGSVSLVTAEDVLYPDLPAGLRPGGPCGTACDLLYILDGGGSAQVGYIDPATHRFVVRYAGRTYPDAVAGCAEYRPVDHYLAIGTPMP